MRSIASGGACTGRFRPRVVGECYVVSLSAATVVYKGLLQGPQLREFYPDLRDASVASALALVHSRFSTNTLARWPLAHPYRYVAHNGEINALRGNLNWMRARDRDLQSLLFPPGHEALAPSCSQRQRLVGVRQRARGAACWPVARCRTPIMTMVPEAWENDAEMDPERRAFYEHESAFMAPWDGPACIAFSDGRSVGATLDRNGLRPARYAITRDGRVMLASEDGALARARQRDRGPKPSRPRPARSWWTPHGAACSSTTR